MSKFGLRWQEFDKNDRVVINEKFFKTVELRKRFADKIEFKDNFKCFIAWID